MSILRKALKEDFVNIYSLLIKFKNQHISKQIWEGIFKDHWGVGNKYYGYVLEDKGKIVGFYSLIFSNLYINGSLHKFCNFGYWIVEK